MKRVVLACRSEAAGARIRRVLSDGGIPVSGVCFSGASALRLARKLGEGILISTRLPDLPAGELARLLPAPFDLIALLDSGQALPPSGSNAVALHLPVSRRDLLAAVTMFLGVPRPAPPGTQGRTQTEARQIAAAKAVLMERHQLSEQDAHRLLQKRSMDAGVRMAELARWILGET